MEIANSSKTLLVRVALVLGLFAAAPAALAGVADTSEAKKNKGGGSAGRIVFASDRTTGTGVENPEGDFEIFVMNPEGKKPKQLTENAADDFDAALSPDGQRIALVSQNVQDSNPEGDSEIYLMKVDGTDQRNLTDDGAGVGERDPRFSPDGRQMAFTSFGKQSSNPEGDDEVYTINANGTEQRNVTRTGSGVNDTTPDYGNVSNN